MRIKMAYKKGWHGESTRHSLASRGIKTAQKVNPIVRKINSNLFKSKDNVRVVGTNIQGQIIGVDRKNDSNYRPILLAVYI